MNKVFVYKTLKNERILEKALGEHHAKPMTRATLPGYVERDISYKGESWPTLWAIGSKASVNGDVIDVNDEELKKLDAWEHEHYRREEKQTSAGPAFVYVFMASKASLGSILSPKTRTDDE